MAPGLAPGFDLGIGIRGSILGMVLRAFGRSVSGSAPEMALRTDALKSLPGNGLSGSVPGFLASTLFGSMVYLSKHSKFTCRRTHAKNELQEFADMWVLSP